MYLCTNVKETKEVNPVVRIIDLEFFHASISLCSWIQPSEKFLMLGLSTNNNRRDSIGSNYPRRFDRIRDVLIFWQLKKFNSIKNSFLLRTKELLEFSSDSRNEKLSSGFEKFSSLRRARAFANSFPIRLEIDETIRGNVDYLLSRIKTIQHKDNQKD